MTRCALRSAAATATRRSGAVLASGTASAAPADAAAYGQHVRECAQTMGFDGDHNPGHAPRRLDVGPQPRLLTPSPATKAAAATGTGGVSAPQRRSVRAPANAWLAHPFAGVQLSRLSASNPRPRGACDPPS